MNIFADERKDDFDKQSPGGKDRSKQDQNRGHKRKHSPGQEDNSGASNTLADEATSPHSELSLLYQTSANDDSFTDDSKYGLDKNKLDSKNSRRKMERPRKRKKESDSDGEGASEGNNVPDHADTENASSPTIETLLNGVSECEQSEIDNAGANVSLPSQSGSNNVPTSPKTVVPLIKSPMPEDLSQKDGVTPNSVHKQSPDAAANSSYTPNGTVEMTDKWASPTNPSNYSDIPTSTSSVRDLEEVMNKHLPDVSSEVESLRGGLHSDFSPSSLSFQKHKSTIQWIGSQHHTSAATDSLPATQLLRSLYANRESVIRSNVYNPRPQYYGDVQSSLLTPPGSTSDPYKDVSPFSAPQVAPAAKTPPTTYSIMSNYSNAISVAMAPNMTESYGITPPSSVSPQEKYASPFDQCHAESGASQLRQYPLEGSTHPMPIKPQAYPLPAHANAHMTAYDRSAQYSATSYYSATPSFPSYNHTTSPAPAHYHESAKNTASW